MYAGKNVLRPQLYAGPFDGPEADRLLAPKQTQKPRGRPKKKRYQWKPKTVQHVRDVRPTVHHQEYVSILKFL